MTGPPDLELRTLTPDDWRAYRQVRLAALRDAPSAFSTTLAEAEQLDEAGWRGRLASRTQIVALAGRSTVGTAGVLPADGHHDAELVSMWVHPEWRGRGVGDRLVAAVLEWARAEGCAGVQLWVSEGNGSAERLYARHGFKPTGACQPVVPGRPGLERQMHRAG